MSLYIYWTTRESRQDPQGGDTVSENESVLKIDLLLSEELLNESVLTEHVIERTTSISDYYYREPYSLRLSCMQSQTVSTSNQDFVVEDDYFELADFESSAGKRHQQGKYSGFVNNRIENTVTALRNIVNYKSSVELVGTRYLDITWMITNFIVSRNQELSNVVEIDIQLKEVLRADFSTIPSPNIERARSRSSRNNGSGHIEGSRDDGEIPTVVIDRVGR